MPTNKLVIGLQNRSQEAFSVLYDDYAPTLFGIAYRIVKNKGVSEEILQDVFVKIWKHIDKYDATKGTLFTWMLNITRNSCKDYFKSKQYHYQALLVQEESDRIPMQYGPQATNDPEENLDLQFIIEGLEPKYKDIIDLVYIAGFTQEQVAEKLNLPLGTIKTRSRAALIILKNYYTSERMKVCCASPR